MSNSYVYNPTPTRVWSRVQNRCTYVDPSAGYPYSPVYIPLTGQTTSLAQANYEGKLQYKGNILQYKGNSSRLTKKQKYTQLAKGFGPNRTKVFATQSVTYSNPNTTGLLRVNSVNIPFPNEIIGEPNNISGPYQYNVPNPYGCPGNSLQDGGNLVCGTYANPCTNEIIKEPSFAPLCYPSSCSDVPGAPIDLCWNSKEGTYFPRQRLTMSNSGTKWPQGYKGFVSAVTPIAPILSLDASSNVSVTLSWREISTNCLPISSYNIYQDDALIQNVPYTTTIYTINDLISGVNYSFYVTSISNTTMSEPSNIILT